MSAADQASAILSHACFPEKRIGPPLRGPPPHATQISNRALPEHHVPSPSQSDLPPPSSRVPFARQHKPGDTQGDTHPLSASPQYAAASHQSSGSTASKPACSNFRQ